MYIDDGQGKTEYGSGVDIQLTGDEIALAIHAWLVGQDVYIHGPCTVRVNDDLCKFGKIYVDPSGYVISAGEKFSGRETNLVMKNVDGRSK